MERVKHLKVPQISSRDRSKSIDMIVLDEVTKIIASGTVTNHNNNNNNNHHQELDLATSTSTGQPQHQSLLTINNINQLNQLYNQQQQANNNNSANIPSSSGHGAPPTPPQIHRQLLLNSNSNNSSSNSLTYQSSASSHFISTPTLQINSPSSPPTTPRIQLYSSTPSIPNTPPVSPRPGQQNNNNRIMDQIRTSTDEFIAPPQLQPFTSSMSGNQSNINQTTPPSSPYIPHHHHISITIPDKNGSMSRHSSFSGIPNNNNNNLNNNNNNNNHIPINQILIQNQLNNINHNISILKNSTSSNVSPPGTPNRNSLNLNGAEQQPTFSPNRASLTLPPVLTHNSSFERNYKVASKKKMNRKRIIKRIRRVIGSIIESNYWIALMVIAILYILFIDDIIGLAGSPSSKALNITIITFKLFVMFFFAVDIVAGVVLYWKRYYPGTIVFWLDLISLLSIVPDIFIYFLDQTLPTSMQVLVIGRAARIIRLCGSFVKISFISTIYNRFLRKRHYNYQQQQQQQVNNQQIASNTGSNSTTPQQDTSFEVEASKLGDKLIKIITNKIVLLVLLVYFVTQLLTFQYPIDRYVQSTLTTLKYQLDQYGSNSTVFQSSLSQYIDSLVVAGETQILSLSINNQLFYRDQSRLDNLQLYAQNSIELDSSSANSIILDESHDIVIASGYHLATTCFVIVLLFIINLIIINDAHWLVINPLENVLAIVKMLSRQNVAIRNNNQTQNQSSGSSHGLSTSQTIFTRTTRQESIGSKSESDNTSNSGVDDVDESDEANYLLGMLNDIDGSLQAAKEQVEEESYQNAKLRKQMEDLFLEKFVLIIHLRSITRKIEFEDRIGESIKKKQLLLLNNIKPLAEGVNGEDIKYRPDEVNLGQHIVVCASLDKIIDRLTKIDNPDIKFVNVFLLTFRRYLTPVELMERLIVRFCTTPLVEIQPNLLCLTETVDDWRRNKQEHIRVAVFNVIKLWIGKYYWDFDQNQDLIDLFNTLVIQIMPNSGMDRYAIHLDTLFKRKVASWVPLVEYQTPKPLSSEEVAQLMVVEDRLLYNFEIIELATQITLIEFELFKSIKPQELIDMQWNKTKTKTKTSPNVIRFIDHFNNVSFWVQLQIVKSGKIKERVSAIKKVIQLGDAFVSLNNFYGAMIVLSSLESSSVSRLHRTWELVPVNSMQSFQSLQKLLSPKGSFKEYRERLKQTSSACIPYLGIYLSDLTFIEEGNPDYRNDQPTTPTTAPTTPTLSNSATNNTDQLINCTKLREIAATILSIQQFQNTLQYYQEVKDRIRSQLDLRGTDNETIWKMSLSAEPRRQNNNN